MRNPDKLVYYSQEDPRWRNILYSNHRDPKQNIAASGCGPTCFAMVVSSLTGRQVLPPETAQYAIDHNFRTFDSGTDWGFFASAADHYGIDCRQTGSMDVVRSALASGALVIASMHSGHFTGGGHYIVLVGVKMIGVVAWIDVFDPNPDNRRYGADGLISEGVKNDGKVSAKDTLFRREAAQYWIFPFTREEVRPKMDPEDANKIIPFLQAAYNATNDKEAQTEFKRLANELRIASGQPTT